MRNRRLTAALTSVVLVCAGIFSSVFAAHANWGGLVVNSVVTSSDVIRNQPTPAMQVQVPTFTPGPGNGAAFSTIAMDFRHAGGGPYWPWKTGCTGSGLTLSACGISSVSINSVNQTPNSVDVSSNQLTITLGQSFSGPTTIVIDFDAGALTTPDAYGGYVIEIFLGPYSGGVLDDYGMGSLALNSLVTFHPNGATGNDTTQTGSYPRQLTANPYTNPGYTFAGWSTSSGSNTVSYGPTATYDFYNNLDLYAVWTATPSQNKTVTFHPNGAPGADSTQSTNTATALTANPFSNPGYTFQGWSTSNSSNTIAYQDTDQYAFSSDIDLYAVWTPVPTVASASVIVIQAQPMLANTGMNSSLPIGIALLLAAGGVGLVVLKRKIHTAN